MSRFSFASLALVAILYGVAAASLFAVPPQEGEIAKYKSDGSYEQRLKFQKSLENDQYAPELIERAKAKIRRAALEADGVPKAKIDEMAPLPPPAWRGMPTTGVNKIPAVLIEFSDMQPAAINTQTYVDDSIFGDGVAANAPYESLTSYYDRASFGKLTIEGSTLGWYRTAYPRSQVTTTPAGRETLIKEALASFDAGHDFAQYDNDNDGEIDYLLVVYAGDDTGWGSFWWAYQTGWSDPSFTIDGKKIGTYVFQFTDYDHTGPFKPLVVIHETGHALGLPDLYDYDGAVGPVGGAGGLDIMDGNRGDHNGFHKWLMEWSTPTVIGSGVKKVTFEPAATSGDGVVVMKGASAANPFDEFFFVENRLGGGNDIGTDWPGSGLMIWHVDSTLDASGNNYLFDNSFTAHKFMRVMEADGLEQIEQGAGGEGGDFWQPGDTFDMQSTPGSARYDGSDSAVEVKDIQITGQNITAFVAAGDAAPALLTASVDLSGRKLTLLFSESVVHVREPTLDFSGGPIKAKFAKGNDTNALQYTLSRHAFRSEDAKLNLQMGSVVDVTGNGNEFRPNFPVIIGVNPDSTPPVVKSAVINASGKSLTMTFDENVEFIAPPALSLTGGSVRAKFNSGSGTQALRFDLSRVVTAKEKGVYDFARGSARNDIQLPNKALLRVALRNDSDVKADNGSESSSEVRKLGKFANYYVDLAYNTTDDFYNDGGGYTGNAYYAYVYSYFALYYRYNAGDTIRWGGKTKKTRAKAVADYMELRNYQAQMSAYALAYSQQDYAMTGSGTSLYAYYYSYYANAYAQQDMSRK